MNLSIQELSAAGYLYTGKELCILLLNKTHVLILHYIIISHH